MDSRFQSQHLHELAARFMAATLGILLSCKWRAAENRASCIDSSLVTRLQAVFAHKKSRRMFSSFPVGLMTEFSWDLAQPV